MELRIDKLSKRYPNGVQALRGKGQEHPVHIHDWIDIGVLDADGNYLFLQKHKFEQKQTELSLIVGKLPAQAGINPLDKLIDRNPDDNLVKVAKQ